MAKQFLMVFEGRSEDDITWGAGMQIHGQLDQIGKLLADYIHAEYKKGHNEPMKIFAEMVSRLEQLDPGGSNGKIIIP